MVIVNKIRLGDLTGSLYRLNNGYYSYKIRRKGTIITRSYVWLNGFEASTNKMREELETLSNQLNLLEG